MCSNTSSGSYGVDLQDDYFGSCPKKQKKVKVRRRGPGVAELEKIRLQEATKSPFLPILDSSSLPNVDHTLFPPPPLPSPPVTSFYNTTPIFRPPATESGGCDLVMMSPNFALPLSSYFSNGSFPMDLIPPAPVFQMKQHSLNPQTMNLVNPSPGKGRFYQFIEPPSNQRSCVDNVSQFLEEDKMMVSGKRPWPFLTDTTKASVGPISTRDTKQNRSVDMIPVQDSGTAICNPISGHSPTSIRRDHPRFMPLSIQYEQQQQDFDENMQPRTKKNFYSFIPSGDQINADSEQRVCEQHESAADLGIDLNLKL